jgi:hypothetical protein
MALILQEYTVKNPIFVFLTFLTDFSNHLLSASASCYFSNLLWLFILFIWGPKNGLQQEIYRKKKHHEAKDDTPSPDSEHDLFLHRSSTSVTVT